MSISKVKPKKHLGQHFLLDLQIAEDIVAAIIIPDEAPYCLEIGPGTGVLTQFLVKKYSINQLKLIEIDKESVLYLKKQYPENEIIESDFLEKPLHYFQENPFSIVGNFPYNISSQIFFKILENPDRIPQVVCMLQKEVAQRLASPPGKKDYGILSVLLQVFYDIEYLFTVPEHVFDPPPKVKSGVIRLTRKQNFTLQVDFQLFKSLVKMGFNQRRKTLRNALKGHTDYSKISHHPFMDKRAEQLTVQDFETLAMLISA